MTRTIEMGDKIMTRVIMNGHQLAEYCLTNVASMTDLLGELRHLLRDVHGLAKIVVRNYNRGWSEEKFLMLYGRYPRPTRRQRSVSAATSSASRYATAQQRMLMPWETH